MLVRKLLWNRLFWNVFLAFDIRRFRKDQNDMRALIDSGREVRATHSAYASKN